MPSQILGIVLLLALSACIGPDKDIQQGGGPGWYRVKTDDTLYSIAWRYGLDYKEVARWNQIDVDSIIYPGQRLLLIEPEHVARPLVSAQSASPKPAAAVLSSGNRATTPADRGKPPSRWSWPTDGHLIRTFAANDLDRRGIDIAGKPGQAIYSVADGRVVYSGNNLAGYGNLIIIKHGHTYLSAYAYNQQRLVQEGMNVKAGDIIARMGSYKTENARLHFQIRKNGKPVNPIQYLPERND